MKGIEPSSSPVAANRAAVRQQKHQFLLSLLGIMICRCELHLKTWNASGDSEANRSGDAVVRESRFGFQCRCECQYELMPASAASVMNGLRAVNAR